MRAVSCGIVIGLSIFAQQDRVMVSATNPQTVQSEPLTPEERCIIEGTVFSATTGEPLRKANLILRRADPGPGSPSMSYTGSSDAAGHFVISDVDPGKYRLSLERAGYVSQQYGAKTSSAGGTILSLEKSQKLKDINFKLTPHGIISGRVLDEDGDPIQNANIQLMRSAYVRGKKQWMPVNGSSTNDLGEYRVFGLAPGRYLLSALYRPSGFLMEATQGGGGEAYAPTYYPNASSPENAAPIEVTAGAQLRGIDIRLAKTKTIRVRGRVIGVTRQPRSVAITLFPKAEGMANMMARNMSRPFNDKGEFVLNNVTPGAYTLLAAVSDDGKTSTASLALDAGNSPIDGITLQLMPPAEVSGRIKIDGPQADVKATNVRVMLQPRNMSMFGMGVQGGLVNEDHTFSLTNVQPQMYDLRIAGTPYGGYVKSIKVGEEDVTESSIDFSNGVPAAEISVVIGMPAGQVSGAVQNEKSEPAPGAVVVLIPEGKRRGIDRFYQMVSTDQNGNYAIRNVVPGEYRLFAFDTVEYGSYQDPEWLKPFESKGERVSVKESDKQSVQLKLVVTQAPQ